MHIITKIISSKKLKEKNKQAEKRIKKSISSFLDLLKNYYHYFVQPEPEKSIMLVYNYIYIQKTELSKKQNKNILLHTRENYAYYNDHDLVTKPLPMNFECRNNSNLKIFEYRNVHKSKPIFVMTRVFFDRSLHQTTSLSYKKNLNTNYLVYKTQSDFSLPPVMS